MDASAERSGPVGRARTWILLSAILAAALGVRLMSLTQEAVWYDELMTLFKLDSPNVVEYLQNVVPRNSAPPGFMIAEYFWSRLVGTSVVALRLFPVLCGVAGLGVLFMLTRRLLGVQTALLVTLWVSFIAWHINYSQELRYYPLSSLFVLLSVWSFIEFAIAPRPSRLALHMLMNACMVWTHPLTAFLCVGQALFLLSFRRNHPRIVAAWFGLHVLLALSLLAFIASLDPKLAAAQTAWIPTPTLWGRSPSMYEFVSVAAGVNALAPTNAAGRALLSLQPWTSAGLVLLLAAATVAGVSTILRPRTATAAPSSDALAPRETVTLLLLWLILPPASVYVLSHVWRPMFIARYILFASFPAYILLAHFLAARPRVFAAAALALLLAHDALFYFPGPTRSRFDQVAAAIQEQSVTPPVIYLDDMLAAPALEFYWRGPKPEFHPPTEMEKAVPTAAKTGADTWLIMVDRRRFEHRVKFLRQDGIAIATQEFSAGHPLWAIHILPHDTDQR